MLQQAQITLFNGEHATSSLHTDFLQRIVGRIVLRFLSSARLPVRKSRTCLLHSDHMTAGAALRYDSKPQRPRGTHENSLENSFRPRHIRHNACRVDRAKVCDARWTIPGPCENPPLIAHKPSSDNSRHYTGHQLAGSL